MGYYKNSPINIKINSDLSKGLGDRRFPTWTTASRPTSPSNFTFGLNTDTKCLEIYNSGQWVSIAPKTTENVFLSASSEDVSHTLPDASYLTGHRYQIKRTDNLGNTVTINTTNSQEIDGETSRELIPLESLILASTGSNWVIL